MHKFFLIIFLFFLDFSVKKKIFYSIDLNNFIYINPFFDLTHIHNFGISFGLFSGILPPWVFIAVGLIIMAFLVFLLIFSNNFLEKWGYTMILAGACGNVFDRLINGFVIDFIYIHYHDFYWPAFNFADIYISIGVFIIILQIINDLLKRSIK